jgi:hypothetical protein
METVHDGLVEGLLRLQRPPLVQRYLDNDGVGGSMNTEIIGINHQRARTMFDDNLEAIGLWNIQDADHGLVDSVANRTAVRGALAWRQIDSG